MWNPLKIFKHQKLKNEVITAGLWLVGEIERDHELGRLSIDSEDCAKNFQQKYTALKEN